MSPPKLRHAVEIHLRSTPIASLTSTPIPLSTSAVFTSFIHIAIQYVLTELAQWTATEMEPQPDVLSPLQDCAAPPPSPVGETEAVQRSPNYGCYIPCDEDFQPDKRHWNCIGPESLRYWETLLAQCNADTRINYPRPMKRDMFAIGGVLVKSDHLGPKPSFNQEVLDMNEEMAVTILHGYIPDIQLPQIFFRSKIRDRDLMVQSRIPGISLEVAWPNLTTEQKISFKEQARDIIKRSFRARPEDTTRPQPFIPRSLEKSFVPPVKDLLDILDTDLVIAHNDMVPSNIIIDGGKIVGLVGWSDAGYFSLKAVSELHRNVRCKGRKTSDISLFDPDVPWHDLYDTIAPVDPALTINTAIKTEASTPAIDTLTPVLTEPASTKAQTPKKVLDLKHKSMSRASSAERASPVPSSLSQQPPKKRAQPISSTKKGIAKRGTGAKRRKLNDDLVSTSKTPPTGKKGKKQTATSSMSSPVPEGKHPDEMDIDDDNDDDDDDNDDVDPSEVFCICRKPDNHTWMIACDGGCEDWYHGKCIGIRQEDADLIDKYICPSCQEKSTLQTSWKPMCRWKPCRKPARVKSKVPSKYCSDDHGHMFMAAKVQTAPPNTKSAGEENDPTNNPSPGIGGSLTSSELKSAVSHIGSAAEFRGLGDTPFSSNQIELQSRLTKAMASPIRLQPDDAEFKDPFFEAEADKVEFFPEERSRLQELRTQKAELDNRYEMLQDRNKFLGVVRQRGKIVFERLQSNGSLAGLQWKDVCGFDNRVSLSDEQFDEWRKTEEGKESLSTGNDIAQCETSLRQAVETEAIEVLEQGLCVRKRCERHKQWMKVMQVDILYEQSLLKDQQSRAFQDAEEIIKKAVLRTFAEPN
ncbi:hypothetical protein FQN57_004778 [Myotisia sp. PD_48]|nr:hypothetical protein FQN57_004778 [Myotisia sp. PD_48]